MASIADLYKDESTAASDRLLSARTGVMNVLQNQQQQGGWASPGIALVAGQEAAKTEGENEKKAKQQEFFTVFGKLLSANGGAAAKYWGDHASSVGIDAKLDTVEANPSEVKVHFENGYAFLIDKANGTLNVAGPDGKFGPATPEIMDAFKKAAQAKKASSSQTPADKAKAADLTTRKDLLKKIADAEQNGAGKRPSTQALRDDVARIEAKYPDEFKGAAPAAPSTPAQSGSLWNMFGAPPVVQQFRTPGASSAAPAPAKRRPIPTF